MRIKAEKLTELIAKLFMAKGLSEKKAFMIAEPLVVANQRGIHSHGVMRAAHYIKRNDRGGSDMLAEPVIISETPLSAVMDAKAGLGAYVSSIAGELTRKKAKENGFGAVLVRNSNHNGAGAYWVEKLAGNDMIGFMCTNTQRSMIAPGAAEPTVGNSPFTVGAPAGVHPFVCLDVATSEAAFGKIMDYKARGLSIPPTWAVDSDGLPTTDPSKAVSLLPFGMHKGYGLSVFVDILTGILAGSAFGKDVHKIYGEENIPQEITHFFMAFRIDLFRDPAEFRADMDRYIDEIHSVRKAEGKEVYLPGEIEYLKIQKSKEEGIEIPDPVVEEILDTAKNLGVDTYGYFEKNQ